MIVLKLLPVSHYKLRTTEPPGIRLPQSKTDIVLLGEIFFERFSDNNFVLKNVETSFELMALLKNRGRLFQLL